MTVSKKIFFNSYKDVNKKEVQDYYKSILNDFKPNKKKILLFVQCSKIKPYSNSPSHKYIRKAIKELTGYDPSEFPEKNPIQIIVISSLIGPVPYERETDYIPSHYNFSVNKITKDQYHVIEPILINRISKFLIKIKDNYENIIFFVKNNYRTICEKVREETKGDFIIIPGKDLHMIREGWVELKYVLLNFLKEKMTVQPISKKIFFEGFRTPLFIVEFTINDFRLQFNLKKKSDKQISNYLLTLRNLNLIKKTGKKYIISDQYLNFLSKYQRELKDSKKTNMKYYRDYILTYSEFKILLKYILYQLYRYSALSKNQLSKKLNVNRFSVNIFLEMLQWLELIKIAKDTCHLTSEAKSYLNKDRYLKLIDKFIKITQFTVIE